MPIAAMAPRRISSCRAEPTRFKITAARRTAGSNDANPDTRAATDRPCAEASTTSTTGAPSSPATCAVDPSAVAPRPSNSPMTPSMTAMSAPAAPRENSGAIVPAPHSTGSRFRAGRPVASAW